MTANATPLPLRNDTILGVCEALGQDFGINAIWFRLAFIAPLFFVPTQTVMAYLGLGVVVALTRWLSPDRKTETAPEAIAAPTPEFTAAASEDIALAA